MSRRGRSRRRSGSRKREERARAAVRRESAHGGSEKNQEKQREGRRRPEKNREREMDEGGKWQKVGFGFGPSPQVPQAPKPQVPGLLIIVEMGYAYIPLLWKSKIGYVGLLKLKIDHPPSSFFSYSKNCSNLRLSILTPSFIPSLPYSPPSLTPSLPPLFSYLEL